MKKTLNECERSKPQTTRCHALSVDFLSADDLVKALTANPSVPPVGIALCYWECRRGRCRQQRRSEGTGAGVCRRRGEAQVAVECGASLVNCGEMTTNMSAKSSIGREGAKQISENHEDQFAEEEHEDEEGWEQGRTSRGRPA